MPVSEGMHLVDYQDSSSETMSTERSERSGPLNGSVHRGMGSRGGSDGRKQAVALLGVGASSVLSREV